jgi:hypothetical protein
MHSPYDGFAETQTYALCAAQLHTRVARDTVKEVAVANATPATAAAMRLSFKLRNASLIAVIFQKGVLLWCRMDHLFIYYIYCGFCVVFHTTQYQKDHDFM